MKLTRLIDALERDNGQPKATEAEAEDASVSAEGEQAKEEEVSCSIINTGTVALCLENVSFDHVGILVHRQHATLKPGETIKFNGAPGWLNVRSA